MSLRELDNLNVEVNNVEGLDPNGLAPEQFVGSLTRDTAHGAGDFVVESFESTVVLTAVGASGQEFKVINCDATLQQGWNFIGYMLPYEQDIADQLAAMIEFKTGVLPDVLDETHFIILKDAGGGAILPEFDFNGVGNFIPNKAYQIKLPKDSPLEGPIQFIVTDDVYVNVSTMVINDVRQPGNLSRENNLENFRSEVDMIEALQDYEQYQNTSLAGNSVVAPNYFCQGWQNISYPRLDGPRDLVEAFQNGIQVTFDAFPTVDDTESTPEQARNSLRGRITLIGTNQIIGIDTSFVNDFEPLDEIGFIQNGTTVITSIASIESDTQITTQFSHAERAGTFGVPLEEFDSFDSYYKRGTVQQVYDLTAKIIIAKDNFGAAYLPEWGFNGIGDLLPGHGYQIKTTEKIDNWFFANDRRSIKPLID